MRSLENRAGHVSSNYWNNSWTEAPSEIFGLLCPSRPAEDQHGAGSGHKASLTLRVLQSLPLHARKDISRCLLPERHRQHTVLDDKSLFAANMNQAEISVHRELQLLPSNILQLIKRTR